MASMNNWLAFSLSPQELQPSQPPHSHLSGDAAVSDCYPLPISTLGHPSFGVLDAFNRHEHHPQDWSMKSLDFKESSSELSMLVGSSSHHTDMDDTEPKLEDFLGGGSFPDENQKLPGAYDNSAEYLFHNGTNGGLVASGGGGSGTSGNSIGLSMIKTWLRNQPAPAPAEQPESLNGNGAPGSGRGSGAMVGSSQGLSLMVASGGGGGEGSAASVNEKLSGALEAVPRKSVETFGQRTSIYRGVTRHRWTGRYEAHLWDNSCKREGQTRKGRQVYLGGYDKEEKAARAYDLAALKYWGTSTTTNFPISNYEKELEEMKHMTRQEYVASLRRRSSGFSRGASIYRGVTRHHQHGRWQARIGRVAGNKDLYLGTFSTQEEAAEAYDIAAIKFRGLNAVTNFEMSRYDVNSILASSTLPIGGAAKRLKDGSDHTETSSRGTDDDSITSRLADGTISGYGHHGWPTIAFPPAQPLAFHYPFNQYRGWCKPEQDSVSIAHNLQDYQQLQLGNNTHDFFQQPAPALHNLISLEPSAMEHSTGSNSVVYNGSIGGSSTDYQGFAMPLSAVVVDQSQSSHPTSSFGDNVNETVFPASGEGYAGTNAYYNMAACHGAPVFTVWNDA